MSKQMLIDATHPEETRVVVLEDGRLDEYDVDTSTKKQIKGNIYLAKVVRVEPSLQAAFVDYGGNRHGFLAFSEIHPDYYQIPVADREAIKEQMAQELSEKTGDDTDIEPSNTASEQDVEIVHDSDSDDIIRQKTHFFRRYKIQEVIRQGQVMLVQVIKEERGNKGAALTTYLSLAGRYSVLMPNNGKGGGVSRKINNVKDRKTLRTIVDKLPIPEGMSVIIRTAGQGKTKTEIKRDYDYLIKTWMQIREMTLKSIAPKLIHEEGDIIKRSLRDVFTPDIDEIWVDGDARFKPIRTFMKTLIPTQIKKIKQYKGAVPLFQEYHVESQLEAIHSNIVQLRSGGYLVIDQTEALVAVDVNSGRATREHNIEETALRTNLETCDELARQLRLRDMAGLIVIDFIDMDEPRNNATVERRLKEALRKDRARIQVGKISGFGLMEMSRQRLHSSFLESNYHVCPHCGGKGLTRSVESCATRMLRLIEDAGLPNKSETIIVSLPPDVASYVLNFKRDSLSALESKLGIKIQILPDAMLLKSSDYRLERIREDGNRVAIQLAQPQNRRQEKRTDKSSDIDALVQAAVLDEESHPTGHRRRSRGQRRRDWRQKQKQLAAEQATANEKHNPPMDNPEQPNTPVSENFTVVEQTTLSDVTQEKTTPDTPKDKGKKGKGKYRDRWKRRDNAKKPTEPAQPSKELVVADKKKLPAKREEKMPAVSEQPAQPTAGDKPAKKGGWWNRLMN